jgi:hypothetical protein
MPIPSPGSGPNFNLSVSMRRLAAMACRSDSMAYSSGWPGERRGIGSGLLRGLAIVQRLERPHRQEVRWFSSIADEALINQNGKGHDVRAR